MNIVAPELLLKVYDEINESGVEVFAAKYSKIELAAIYNKVLGINLLHTNKTSLDLAYQIFTICQTVIWRY